MISEAWSLRAPNLCGRGNQEVDVRDPLRQHNDWSPRCIRGSLTQQMDEAPAWGHVRSGNDHTCPPSQEVSVQGSRDSPGWWSLGEGMRRRDGGLTNGGLDQNICRQPTWLDLHSTPYTQINSKEATDSNIKATTMKLSEINIGEILCDGGMGKEFLRLDTKSLTHKRENR